MARGGLSRGSSTARSIPVGEIINSKILFGKFPPIISVRFGSSIINLFVHLMQGWETAIIVVTFNSIVEKNYHNQSTHEALCA